MERREVRRSRVAGGEARRARVRARMKGKAKVKVTASRGQLRRPNWLPDGWIVEDGVGEDGGQVKRYKSLVSQKVFSSKEEVLHYLRATKFVDHVSKTSSEHNKQNERNSPEWLPRGWILEIKTRLSGDRAGKKYKSYFDPFSGSRFYSKSQVLRFLNSGKLNTPTSGEKQRFKANPTDNVIAQIEYSPDGLPHGWIKETKFRKSSSGKGTKGDPYYTDPVSGYVFRSLKDAIHYVRTGERGQYALGPRKSRIIEMCSLEKESPIPIPVKELKSPGFTGRCLFTEEASTSSGEDIQQRKVGTDKKRRIPEAANPVIPSEHREQKAKRVRRPRNGSKLEVGKEESEWFVEPATIIEKPSEPPIEVTPVGRERKQRISKGELASLPRRSSKRLAGVEAAPAIDLVIRRPTCQLRSNGRSCRVENSVLFTDSGEAAMGQTSEGKPLSHQSLSNGSCNGIEESAPVKEPERKDTADEASEGEQMLFTGQTSEVKPPSRQLLSKDRCNGIEESAPLILIEPIGKDTADEISQGAGVPSCSQLLSSSRRNGLKEFTPLIDVTADEASEREQASLRGQTSENRPPSRQPLSNGRLKGTEGSAISLQPEGVYTGEEPGEQVPLAGRTSQDRPSSTPSFGACWDDPCIQFAVKTLTGEIPVLDVGIAIDEYVQKQLSSAEVLCSSASGANVASDNHDFDLSKLLGPMESPKTQNLGVSDEGKRRPLEKLPSHSGASTVRGSTSRVQGTHFLSGELTSHWFEASGRGGDKRKLSFG